MYNEKDQNAISTLQKQGIQFKEQTIKGTTLKDVVKRKRVNKKDEALEKEIAKTLYRKNEKVKPGYKKKRKNQIERIKRKAKREFIKNEIKKERKG